MENFKAIYRILRYLERAMDYDEPDMDIISASALGLSEARWISILEMLADENLISGLEIRRSSDGGAALSISNPRITLHGLEYLQENPQMLKAAEMAKGR